MKKQQGFSLVELMIVVAVIGVLSAVAVPAYQNYVKKAEAGAALATLNALKTNVEDYIATNSSFPATAQFGDIGTTADVFKYGTLSGTAAESAPGGELKITFSKTNKGSSLDDNDALLVTRDTDGVWTCTTSGFVAAEKPKGCS